MASVIWVLLIIGVSEFIITKNKVIVPPLDIPKLSDDYDAFQRGAARGPLTTNSMRSPVKESVAKQRDSNSSGSLLEKESRSIGKQNRET